jgi:AraC-like DNA-binding protein
MPTVLASMARIVLRIADAHGLDGDSILRAHGLDPELTHELGGRYAFRRMCAAWVTTADRTKDPAIGLQAARHYNLLDLQALGVAFLSSGTLLTALRRLDRFERVLNTRVDYTIVERGERVDLTCNGLDLDASTCRLIEDARLAVLLDLCRTGTSKALDPVAVALPYTAPASFDAYREFFRCPVEFGAPVSRLSFAVKDAHLPFTTANRDLARNTDQILDRMLRGLRRADLASRVEAAIVEALPSGTPKDEEIAQSLLMSRRTLQRRLAKEGTSFKKLLAHARRTLAEQYVADRTMAIAEIGYMLGFADASSFTRAFRRWCGVPPASFRTRTTTFGAAG